VLILKSKNKCSRNELWATLHDRMLMSGVAGLPATDV